MTAILNQIAQNWFSWQLSMFWQVGVLIVIVAALDLVIRKWAWPQVRYALWLLILVKLILPPTLTSPTSFTAEIPFMVQQAAIKINQPQKSPQIYKTVEPFVIPAVETKPIVSYTSKVVSIADAETVTAVESLTWMTYVLFIWFGGVAILSGWLVIRLRNLRREHLKDQSDLPERLKELLASTAGKLGLKKVPQIILTNKVCCPAVFGVFRPVLLMPSDKLQNLTMQDAENILLHELAHIKRGDLLAHAVYMILQIAYWFNPLIWLTRKHLQNLRELCCDATVARMLREKTAGYRQTLIETARQLLAQPVDPGLGLLGLFENSSWLVDRLHWLEKKSWRYRPLRVATVFVLICVMSTCVLPMTKYEAPANFVIKGTVTDAQTGKPIAGAKVGDTEEYADGRFSTTTDSNGNYSYKTWYEEHGVKAIADGYQKERKTLLTKIFGREKEKVINFQLKATEKNNLATEFTENTEIKKTPTKDDLQIHYDHAGLTQITVEKGSLEYIWHTLKKDSIFQRQDLSSYDRHNFSKKLTDADITKFKQWIEDTNLFSLPESFPDKNNKTYGSAFKTNLKIISGKKQYTAKWTGDSNLPENVIKADSKLKSICDNLFNTNVQIEAEKPAGQDVKQQGVDLYIENFNISPYEAGGLYTVTAKIGNRGSVTAPAFRLNFYRGDPKDNLNLHGKVQSGSNGAGPIKSGEFWNEQSSPFALKEGINQLTVILDTDNSIAETNKLNNSAEMNVLFKNGKIIKKSAGQDAVKIGENSQKTIGQSENNKPKIVSMFPPSGSEMALVSELKLVFDQPMQANQFEISDASLEEKFKGFSNVSYIKFCVVYDPNTYQFTIPLLLSCNWNGSVAIRGFKSQKGVEIEPVTIKYSTLQEPLSKGLLERFEKARQSKELRRLLEQIKQARSQIRSLQETVHTTHNYGQDKGKEENIIIFKMQGDRQFYVDMSQEFKKPWMIGSDGRQCWFYNKYENEKPLVSADYNEIDSKNISICDPFGLSQTNVDTALKENNLEYIGTGIIGGKKCYIIRSWSAYVQIGRANCCINTQWIDAETFMPVHLLQEYNYGKMDYEFSYERINQKFDDSEFKPQSVTDIAPKAIEPLGEGYNTRYINIIDGSKTGSMSVRWGKEGSGGTSSSGLN